MSIVTDGLGGNQLILHGLGEQYSQADILGVGILSEEAHGIGTITVGPTADGVLSGYWGSRIFRRMEYAFDDNTLDGIGSRSEEESGTGTIEHANAAITDEDVELLMAMLMAIN